ncbi:hypothetical protein DV096_07960 [Bradymonadaceae bacterium TMQ3]|nr:hypothetical protein DV096_07960 [Bradymonadaceae bacterium TMQ3]TXC76495.1 hypothetical protein FRC91_07115 [Bradymonadales bacterium TMQ1]
MTRQLEDIAPNYQRACQRWPDSPLLKRQEANLRECLSNESHGLVEHIKSFIECVCLTTIHDFGKEPEKENPSLTDLLICALDVVGYHHSRRPRHLGRMLSAFNKLANALSDMRNYEGETAHGKDAFDEIISEDYARAFLFAGDAILALLLNALDAKTPNLATTRQPYERFAHFNKRIDEAINIDPGFDETGDRPTLILSFTTNSLYDPIEITVNASQLLYHIDREAYIEILNSLRINSSKKAHPSHLNRAESKTIAPT